VNSSLNDIKVVIKQCISQLYTKDEVLFERNEGKGVCERSLVFRFAHYLQNKIHNHFFVDCDFNSSSAGNGKPIVNEDGTKTKRFIDIIVHKRDFNIQNNFLCFEFKKWNNNKTKETIKDINNLVRLTSHYGYIYGFHIILHKNKSQTKWTIFQDGKIIENNTSVFANEQQINNSR